MAVDAEQNVSQGNDPARWVDRYGDVMLSFALARTGRQDVAEDLVQETFLAAWRARDTYEKRSKFGTWLLGILRRKIADYFRASGREPARRSGAAAESDQSLFDGRGKWVEAPAGWQRTPDELAENAEFWTIFANCLSDMPVHLAQAFQLREFGLATMNQICQTAGITPKNLSVRLHRARLLLRQCLERKWFRNE